MKKFYTFSLMALAAVSMSAAAPTASVKNSARIAEADFTAKIRTISEVSQPNRVIAKADLYEGETWNELGSGKYAASILAEIYGGTTDPVDVIVFEAEGKAGLYKVEGVWPDKVPDGVLYVDATDPEFVQVKNQFTGLTDNVDGVTYIASLSAVAVDEYGFDKTTFLAYFEEANAYVEDGIIYFPAGALNLQWPEAPADSQYGTDPTEWYGGDKEGFLVLPGAEYVDPWSESIEATMVETFVSPKFTKTESVAGTPYTVEIKINNTTNNIRVIDPLKLAYATFGWNAVSPDMYIDFTDPTNVSVPIVSTGINGGQDGVYYYTSLNNNYDDPSKCPEAQRITLTKEDGNTIVTFPLKSMLFIAMGTGDAWYACEGVPSSLTFKTPSDSNGVEGIAIDNNNAKVEYFNLQGVRVENPAAGQLVIKRQGSEVSKMVVR